MPTNIIKNIIKIVFKAPIAEPTSIKTKISKTNKAKIPKKIFCIKIPKYRNGFTKNDIEVF